MCDPMVSPQNLPFPVSSSQCLALRAFAEHRRVRTQPKIAATTGEFSRFLPSSRYHAASVLLGCRCELRRLPNRIVNLSLPLALSDLSVWPFPEIVRQTHSW